MIKFINANSETVYSVESKKDKDIKIALKYSPDTIRFLQNVFNIQNEASISQIEAASMAKYLPDDPNSKNIDMALIKQMSTEEMTKIINIGNSGNNSKITMLQLFGDMLDLLKLSDCHEEFSIQDLSTIYKLITTDPVNSFPI